ncbi:protein PFC0760c-like isoform X9 [Stylophora pistillata]|uniref:protein PFC0760c-like isoform X9 n=1 Tax=Stylophora pistillata TaxID=50429 RepID=UPI000C047C69|nr:protein PFC0760c-like isoform X9 [Stylophora pistillata]
MKLWVGIVFLVVFAQQGANARPIPRLRPLLSDGAIQDIKQPPDKIALDTEGAYKASEDRDDSLGKTRSHEEQVDTGHYRSIDKEQITDEEKIDEPSEDQSFSHQPPYMHESISVETDPVSNPLKRDHVFDDQMIEDTGLNGNWRTYRENYEYSDEETDYEKEKGHTGYPEKFNERDGKEIDAEDHDFTKVGQVKYSETLIHDRDSREAIYDDSFAARLRSPYGEPVAVEEDPEFLNDYSLLRYVKDGPNYDQVEIGYDADEHLIRSSSGEKVDSMAGFPFHDDYINTRSEQNDDDQSDKERFRAFSYGDNHASPNVDDLTKDFNADDTLGYGADPQDTDDSDESDDINESVYSVYEAEDSGNSDQKQNDAYYSRDIEDDIDNKDWDRNADDTHDESVDTKGHRRSHRSEDSEWKDNDSDYVFDNEGKLNDNENDEWKDGDDNEAIDGEGELDDDDEDEWRDNDDNEFSNSEGEWDDDVEDEWQDEDENELSDSKGELADGKEDEWSDDNEINDSEGELDDNEKDEWKDDDDYEAVDSEGELDEDDEDEWKDDNEPNKSEGELNDDGEDEWWDNDDKEFSDSEGELDDNEEDEWKGDDYKDVDREGELDDVKEDEWNDDNESNDSEGELDDDDEDEWRENVDNEFSDSEGELDDIEEDDWKEGDDYEAVHSEDGLDDDNEDEWRDNDDDEFSDSEGELDGDDEDEWQDDDENQLIDSEGELDDDDEDEWWDYDDNEFSDNEDELDDGEAADRRDSDGNESVDSDGTEGSLGAGGEFPDTDASDPETEDLPDVLELADYFEQTEDVEWTDDDDEEGSGGSGVHN